MQNRTLALIFTLAAFVPPAVEAAEAGRTVLSPAERDDEANVVDEPQAAARVEVVDGLASLVLDPAVQERSGIVTEPLNAVDYRPESRAIAHVVDLQPLLQLRADYADAVSAKSVADAALAASERAYRRMKLLHRERIVPARRLEEAQALWRTDKARRRAAEQRMRSILENALQRWGRRLADWALTDDSETFQRLLRRQEIVLLVTLDSDAPLPPGLEKIAVGRHGDRSAARTAEFMGPAPQADAVSQGETYFFLSAADGLRTGMRLDAWIPSSKAPRHGVQIPQSAVVWHGGQPWCYVKTGTERFTRRPLNQAAEYLDGWFVNRGFAPGEHLVTQGAQMLLSEEFRRQIPDEDED